MIENIFFNQRKKSFLLKLKNILFQGKNLYYFNTNKFMQFMTDSINSSNQKGLPCYVQNTPHMYFKTLKTMHGFYRLYVD